MHLWRTLSVSVAVAILAISLAFPVLADDIGRDYSKGDTLAKFFSVKLSMSEYQFSNHGS